jgi:hypothetical protein
MAHVCNPRYREGIGRRIVVKSDLDKKHEILSERHLKGKGLKV